MRSSAFQFAVIGISTALIVIGVATFAIFGGRFGSSGDVGTVVMWGSADSGAMQDMLEALKQSDTAFNGVSYIEKNPATYASELVNAIASGRSPDLFLLPEDEALSFADKVALLPSGAISESQFTNTFIDAGELFLGSEGTLAIPLLVDPLVMYWNRDLLSASGIAVPPAFWSDLLSDAPKITAIDSSTNIRRSATALGTWSNIGNAKAILSALVMQAGDPLVSRGPDGSLQAVFGNTPPNAVENPAESALRFYTQFADPVKSVYSWNRSLPPSDDAFAAGDVGLYFGFASEYGTLRARNPNLRIGVSELPQARGRNIPLTFARVTGVAVSRGAPNPQGAVTIALKLGGPLASAKAAEAFGLPPVRRDLLVNLPEEAVANTFARSALISRSWLDPRSSATDTIFQRMIESILSGESVPAEAVLDARRDLDRLVQ